MHAVLITFSAAPDPGAAAELLADAAQRLAALDGCCSATWIQHGDTLGGFHVFVDAEAAEACLASDDLADVMLHPDVADFKVEQFDVLGQAPMH